MSMQADFLNSEKVIVQDCDPTRLGRNDFPAALPVCGATTPFSEAMSYRDRLHRLDK